MITRWNELNPEGYYDFDTKALRLAARSGGKFVFGQLSMLNNIMFPQDVQCIIVTESFDF
jgi:hypothetical protein